MLTVEAAQNAILDACRPCETVTVPLLETLGRALAADVASMIPLPPFDNSAMDGYAIVSRDTEGASPASPVSLEVIGDLPAGGVANVDVVRGAAVRIMTGAPIPAGADAVVAEEDTRSEGSRVVLTEPTPFQSNIRPAGDDIQPGATILHAGREIDPPALAMMAAIGESGASVIRRPRISVLTTGDEVIDVGRPLGAGEIYDSNRYGIAAQVSEAGCDLAFLEHVKDDIPSLRAALHRAVAAGDAVITTGGVSVGDYDFMKEVLQGEGRMDFWRVAVKPGRPIAFGAVSGKPLFGLPGNPVSAMLTFELFVRPALRKMGGHSVRFRPTVTATAAVEIHHRPGRREYQRARIEWENGRLVAHPLRGQGSHHLYGLVESNGFIIVPEELEAVPAGVEVGVLLL